MATALPDAARAACEHVCLSWRRWAPGERRAPIPTRLLTRGHSNHAVLLRGEHGRWVLRVGAAKPPLGVCRERELAVHRRAAAAGLAPPVRLADPAAGILVTDYLERDRAAAARGRNKEPAGPGGEGSLEDPGAIAALLRDIHGLTETSTDAMALGDVLNSAERLARWRLALADGDPIARSDAEDDLRDAVARVASSPCQPVLCHNDLLGANRIAHRGRLHAIDWEYACPGDPFFDLAAVASELDDSQRELLLERYLARMPQDEERRRLAD